MPSLGPIFAQTPSAAQAPGELPIFRITICLTPLQECELYQQEDFVPLSFCSTSSAKIKVTLRKQSDFMSAFICAFSRFFLALCLFSRALIPVSPPVSRAPSTNSIAQTLSSTAEWSSSSPGNAPSRGYGAIHLKLAGSFKPQIEV